MNDNIKEFKELIDKYESITIKQIQDTMRWENERMFQVLNLMTGFSDSSSCTLCYVRGTNCMNCVYSNVLNTNHFACLNVVNDKSVNTYERIIDSDTPRKLVLAVRARAKHMRAILKQLNIE